MLLLLFAIIVSAFLLLGSTVFLTCVVVPPLRPYALSAALWCAVWGPCSIGLMLIAGVGLVAEAFITKGGAMHSLDAPKLVAAFGWGYLISGIFVTAVAATVMAWIHQALARRMTFALFRLYATAVSAGIGSVFGWALGYWIMANEVHYRLPLWVLGMMTMIAGFGVAAHKGARTLRGKAPTNFTWISPEEFAGTTEP